MTGYGNRWTRERVTSLRSHHRIPVYKPAEDGTEPWLNLSRAARLLHVSPRTLRLAAQAGEIEAIHPLPDGPWIFSRNVLSTASARSISERARQNPKYPAGSHSDQQTYSLLGVAVREARALVRLAIDLPRVIEPLAQQLRDRVQAHLMPLFA